MIEQLVGLVIFTMAVIALVDVIRWQIRSKSDDVYLDPESATDPNTKYD